MNQISNSSSPWGSAIPATEERKAEPVIPEELKKYAKMLKIGMPKNSVLNVPISDIFPPSLNNKIFLFCPKYHRTFFLFS